MFALKEPVWSLGSSPSTIWAVTERSVDVFTNNFDVHHIFSMPHTMRLSQSLLSPSPASVASTGSWFAMVQRDVSTLSASADRKQPSIGTVEGVTQNVMSAMYKATDWGRRAVGNFLDKPSLQPPSLPTFGSTVTITDIKSRKLLCEFSPFNGQTCAAVAFDASGMLFAAAAGDGHGVAIYSLLGCQEGTPPSLVAMCIRGATRAVVTQVTFSSDSRSLSVVTANGTCHVFTVPSSVLEIVFGSPAPSNRPAVITYPPQLAAEAVLSPSSDVSIDDGDVNPVPVTAASSTLVATVPSSISQWKQTSASTDLPGVPVVYAAYKIRDDVIRGVLPDTTQPIALHVATYKQTVLVAQAGLVAEFSVGRTLPSSGPVTHCVRFGQLMDFRRSLKWKIASSVPPSLTLIPSPAVALHAAQTGRQPRAPVPDHDAIRAYWASRYEPVTHDLPVVPFWRSPMVTLTVKDPLQFGSPLPVVLHSVADHATLTRARKLRLVGKGSTVSGARRISECYPFIDECLTLHTVMFPLL